MAFDADQTLVDTTHAVETALTAVVAAVGEPSLTFEVFSQDGADFWRRMPELPAAEIRRAALRHTLSRAGREAEVERVAELFFETRYAHSRPFPGVVEVLGKLRTDFRVGYATNGNSMTERCGLGGAFDFELYALIDGVPKKPAGAFYERMIELAGCAPSEIVYVGDSYEHDVVGPAGFGIRTVWLNPLGEPVPGRLRPDAVIENLSQLPRILAGWR